MKFKQFYLGCLSHASYYLGSEGEAAVIDPQRDVQQYIDEAEANGQTIKYVIETHAHADFVSGHVELANATGAKIIYGRRAETQFDTLKVADGDELSVGSVKLWFLETPGHTPEGITILAEAEGETPKLFTGDTLFIGDVGRPDLVGSKGFTAEEMGGMLYDSLHAKILPLSDDTEIYPAHGAGSLCGKSLSTETWSTLGEQRRTNYALRPMSKEEFVKIVASGQPTVPAYFPKSAAQNLAGSAPLSELAEPTKLSEADVTDFGGVLLDVRPAAVYGAGHIPNSINIGLGGQFASWAGSLIPIGTAIAIVADTKEEVDEAIVRLARVGHENAGSYILFGEYDGEVRSVKQVSVTEAAARDKANSQLIDVRRIGEYNDKHAAGAEHFSLDELAREVGRIDPKVPAYVICLGGYRSSIGTGILENAGIETIYNVTGGTRAWAEAGLETETEAATAVSG